ncbi:MAG: DUF86 domain-containing protein [Geobacteraceae bacterium]|nr:DUF86 domain-containing protein [Geobacteraceae bacterium]
MNDVVMNKKESVERCIRQIRAYYATISPLDFEEDYMKQDSIAINLQRACEQCIDLANYTIKARKLGLPKESKESFALLATAGIISNDLAKRLQGMVGFRNILVHEYQRMDISLMVDVIENRLDDMVVFSNHVLHQFANNSTDKIG